MDITEKWLICTLKNLKMNENKTYLTGIIGEFFAIVIYFFKGYRLLKRRYKSKLGEIDLILRNSNRIIFCEVKTRLKINLKEYDITNIVTKYQQDRIIRSANSFMQKSRRYKNMEYRFDIMIVTSFYKLPLHIKNAFW